MKGYFPNFAKGLLYNTVCKHIYSEKEFPGPGIDSWTNPGTIPREGFQAPIMSRNH